MPVTTFTVPFVRGKQRPRFFRRGKHTGTFTPKETAQAMYDVATAYRGASLRKHGEVLQAPKGVAVTIAITTMRPLPKSRPKRVFRERDVYKPDADNTAKLILDGLNGVAWEDDTQVTDLHVHKYDRMRDVHPQTRVLVMWEE